MPLQTGYMDSSLTALGGYMASGQGRSNIGSFGLIFPLEEASRMLYTIDDSRGRPQSKSQIGENMLNRTAHLTGALLLLLTMGVFASAQNAPLPPTVSHPSASAVSSRLSDLPESESAEGEEPKETHPHHQVPPHESATDKNDDALQTTIHKNLDVNQQPSFAGVGSNGYIPPDPNIAVGPNHIVQVVNVQIGVFDKASGAMHTGYPKTLSSLWAPLSGDCATQNAGDPIAQYDAGADRWLITQLGSLSPPFSQCIAVSQSSDPTGQYNLYSYSFGNNLNDYAKFGVWPTSTNSAYLSTANLFANGASFVGAALCAYERAAMLSGASSPTALCYTISNDGGFLPSDQDGLTPPPAGSPGYFLTFETLSSLRLYLFTPNFANPNSSTLSAPTDINVSPFNMACGGGTCIPQPGTSRQLDSLADRLMYRLAYRNFGDHEAMVVNHSVTSGSSVGLRWYELRGPFSSGTPTVYQQGTFAPDSDYRWMGSIAMDKNGDMALGYSTSSTTTYPAVRFTGRTSAYPLNTMAPETTLQVGGGSQTGYTRWGDYTSVRIDPSDDTTFWYTNEYYSNTSSGSWKTFIGSFRIVPAAQDFSLSTNPSSLTVAQGSSGSSQVSINSLSGFNSSVTLSVSGCPTSGMTTCTLSPTSATPPANGSTSVTLNISTTGGTPTGTYTITITGTSGNTTHSTTVSLTIAAVLTSIAVTPANPSASAGSTVQFKATGNYSDNSSKDITLSVTWTSSSTNVATINTSGLATALAQGATTITATSGGMAGTTTLTVTGASADFTISLSPGSQTVNRGSSGTYTVTITAVNGSSMVSLSVSGLPRRTSGTFNPSSVTSTSGGVTSTLTVTVRSTATSGRTTTFTVRGTNGTFSHSASAQITVN